MLLPMASVGHTPVATSSSSCNELVCIQRPVANYVLNCLSLSAHTDPSTQWLTGKDSSSVPTRHKSVDSCVHPGRLTCSNNDESSQRVEENER